MDEDERNDNSCSDVLESEIHKLIEIGYDHGMTEVEVLVVLEKIIKTLAAADRAKIRLLKSLRRK